MAHLMAPQHSLPTLPVFFNVDEVVGAPPAMNRREDVLLVQFAFTVIAAKPSPSSSPAFHAAVAAVRCTGNIDPQTIAAITAAQEQVRQLGQPGTTVDGRVSPARGVYSYGGGMSWTIVHLNESMQARHLEIWPRIDLIQGCPDELKAMVVRTVQGT